MAKLEFTINGKHILPGIGHNINCRCVIVFPEPKQLELKLVQMGTWDEIYNVTNWQPGRKEK